MHAADLAFASLTEVSRLLERRDVSSSELVELCLERAQHTRFAEAFVRLTPEAALADARRLDGEPRRGPLHGVPIAHKDCWDTAGVATEAACAVYAGRTPAADATLVRRLADAGAISIGKTTMPELANGDAGLANPHHPHASPGGSSAGSGVAVAAGLCYAATGSDGGGSIRVPAAMCGVVGIKPTYGRVSRHGGIPHAWTMDHAGPLARTVADAAVVLEAMSGYDPADPGSADEPVPSFSDAARDPSVRGVRVGVVRNYSFAGCAAEVRDACAAAVERLARLGADVREIDVANTQLEVAAWAPILFAEFAAVFAGAARRHGIDVFGPVVRAELAVGSQITAAQLAKAQQLRGIVQRSYADAFGDVDVLVTAGWARDARWWDPRITEHVPPGTDGVVKQALSALLPGYAPDPEATAAFFPTHNLTGLPALVLPVAWNEAGLPLSLQVVGDAFDECSVIRTAAALEADLALGVRRPAD